MKSIVDYQPDPLPSILELCNDYGDPDCTKVHTKDYSVLRKWLALYWADRYSDKPLPVGVDPALYALA
ncbi:MAG: hypothetical protein WBH35_10190 [Bacillota bacterium]|jgi:hypothetical protein|nr:hypothetical protein [Bacillota bacterium]HOB92383.1 hypothetical protein [Bacillota bacterium]HPZ55489.1 hypothetical protein [Bacillota bacterium]HQD18960.1 hypothetical protein [Bacillota bacterium]